MLIKKICCIGADDVGGSICSIIAMKCPEIDVYVVDQKEELIMQWNSEKLPVFEPGLDEIVKKCINKNLFFTSDMTTPIKQAEIIFICGKAPPKTHSFGFNTTSDLKFIEDAARLIANAADSHKIIVEKTAVDFRASEAISTILKANQKPGLNFEVISNPEFFQEGSAVEELLNPERILIGAQNTPQGEAATESLVSVYEHWIPRGKVITTDILSAELSKLVTSAFICQKISSINSLSEVCEATNADVAEVASVIGLDSRIGSKLLEPTLGFGGARLQQDLHNLIHLCDSLHLPEVAAYWQKILDMNEHQKKRFVSKIIEAFFNTVTDKKISIFGFACKKGTSEATNCPALFVCKELLVEGSKLSVFDPVVSKRHINEELLNMTNGKEAETITKSVKICKDAYEAATGAHGIVFCTDWDHFKNLDFGRIYDSMAKPAHIFDGLNFLPHKDLMDIGFQVHTIGKALTGNSPPKF